LRHPSLLYQTSHEVVVWRFGRRVEGGGGGDEKGKVSKEEGSRVGSEASLRGVRLRFDELSNVGMRCARRKEQKGGER